MAGVVFNALAVAHFTEHFQVKTRALRQALGFHQLAFALEEGQPLAQLFFDGFHSGQHLVAWRDVMAARVHGKAWDFLLDAPGERVEQLQAFHLVVKQLYAQRQLGVLCREHVNGVAAHTEFAPAKVQVVALVLHTHQLGNGIALAQGVARAQRHDHAVVALGLANAVDGRHRGHNHHVAPLQQAFGTRQAHLLDVLVDGAVFFNEQVALRHIGLGLVVVVVADEVLHCVLRKELAKLAVQLRGQGFVGRKDDGWPPQAGDDVGHGEGFARTRHAQQGLEGFAVFHALHQLFDGGGLVAGRGIRLEQVKGRAGKFHKLTRSRGSARRHGANSMCRPLAACVRSFVP